jgi:hypothetical protein
MPTRSLRRAPALLLPLLLAVGPLAGCGIDEADLARWKEVREGQERLSGYLASPDRPLGLRVRAARYLFEINAGGQIVVVLRDAAAEDRQAVLEPFLVHLGKQFTAAAPEEQARAKDMLYALLPLLGGVSAEFADGVVKQFADWAVVQLFAEQPPAGRPVDQVLIAAGLTRPAATVEPLVTALSAEREPARVQRLSGLVDAIGDVPGRLKAASALLTQARRALPNPPEPLLQAIAANGNETLLRFLLDAARDPEVPLLLRAQCVDLAVGRLGKGAIPGLEEILKAEDPVTQNAMREPAMVQLYRLRGPKKLTEMMAALPDGTGWPDEGNAFREQVDKFCMEAIAPQKAKARKDLLETIGSENRTARIFAAYCISRLYPDEVGELLAPLKDDKTPLRGFGREPPPTQGDRARGKLGD